MRERLEAFCDLVGRYERARPPGEYIGDERLYDELHRAEPTIKRILEALDPALAKEVNIDQMAGPAMARNEVQRALGLISDKDDLDRRLAPDCPILKADRLHPWVWQAAQTFWDSDHFRAAVHAAASAINAHTQDKLGRRDVADDKLIQEGFSDKAPETGKNRLRIPGDQADQTVQSRQRGAMQLGLGCFFAIRNSAAHGVEELPEQIALEQLAALSVLARLIDECLVVDASKPK
jgi:Protein of unknown function (Hypoth_ymh)